jgi:hypothetical protein
LLPDDDEAVVRELERFEMNKAKAKDKLEKDTKWQEEHQRVFKQHGCLWGQLQPLHDVAKSRWFAAVPPREKDILTLMPVVHKHITRCDTSQGIVRCRPSSSEFCFTCTPNMRAYDFLRDRYYVGRESLKLQGIDWEDIPNLDAFAETDLADLGGNAFAGPCIMAAFLGTIATVPIQQVLADAPFDTYILTTLQQLADSSSDFEASQRA